MNRAEQISPVLPCTAARQVCRASSSLGVQEGKAIHSVLGWEDTSEEYHLLFPLFLYREARLPKVSFFWASLMEQEIIMSWPVNNCMPQWDICHYDILYVLHPDSLWPNREVPLLFFCSPLVSSAVYWRQTNTRGSRCRGGKRDLWNVAVPSRCVCKQTWTPCLFLKVLCHENLKGIQCCPQSETFMGDVWTRG